MNLWFLRQFRVWGGAVVVRIGMCRAQKRFVASWIRAFERRTATTLCGPYVEIIIIIIFHGSMLDNFTFRLERAANWIVNLVSKLKQFSENSTTRISLTIYFELKQSIRKIETKSKIVRRKFQLNTFPRSLIIFHKKRTMHVMRAQKKSVKIKQFKSPWLAQNWHQMESKK